MKFKIKMKKIITYNEEVKQLIRKVLKSYREKLKKKIRIFKKWKWKSRKIPKNSMNQQITIKLNSQKLNLSLNKIKKRLKLGPNKRLMKLLNLNKIFKNS